MISARIHSEALAEFNATWQDQPQDHRTSVDGGILGWNYGPILHVLNAAYEGTRDQKYLDKAAESLDIIFANRSDRIGIIDEFRGRMMPAWVTSNPRYLRDGKTYASSVHAGMILYPAVRWAYLVQRDFDDPALLAQAARYIADAEETIAAYEYEWRTDDGVKLEDGGLGGDGGAYGQEQADGRWKRFPLNCSNVIGRVLRELWVTTDKPEYLDKVTRLAKSYKAGMWCDGDKALWGYDAFQVRPTRRKPDNVSYGQSSVDFACLCHRCGVVFTTDDLRKIARTFHGITKRDDEDILGWRENIDGSGGLNVLYKSTEIGGWYRLAAVDPGVAETLWAGRKWLPAHSRRYLCGRLLELK